MKRGKQKTTQTLSQDPQLSNKLVPNTAAVGLSQQAITLYSTVLGDLSS
jgi:hypothetical protein